MSNSPDEDADHQPPAAPGAEPPVRGLRAVERVRAARTRNRKWIVLTTIVSLLAVAAIVLLFGLRPKPSPDATDPAAPFRGPRELDAAELAAWSAPVIRVRAGEVLLDGTLVARVDDLERSGSVQRVDGLYDALKRRREQFKSRWPGAPFPGDAILDVDEDVRAAVVKSVFQTAAFAGYPNTRFRLADGGLVGPR